MRNDIRRFYQEKHSVLNSDTYDRERFANLTEQSPKLGELVKTQLLQSTDFPALMGDMWASLYKMKPELKKLEEDDVSSPVNRTFIERIMSDEEFHKFRLTTKLDDFTSAIGSMRMNEKVHAWIEKERSKNKELNDLLNQLKQKQKEQIQQQQKRQQANNASDEANENGTNTEKKSAEKKAKKETEKADGLAKDVGQLQKSVDGQLQNALQAYGGQSFSEAIKAAKLETVDAKEDLQNLLSGGAGTSEAEMKKMPLRDQINMAELLRDNKKLKEIADWAGKFKAIAKKKNKVKHNESIERSGMTLGDDVERLLPQELGMLLNKRTKLDFLRRFAEGQTMMYSPKGKETLGQGPMVVCLDQSGSMSSLDTQSKGFVLSLAMIAKKQRRNFCLITFSVKMKTRVFKKGKITPTDLVEIAEDFLSGGTKYESPLKEARRIISEEKHFKNADIIFVTDGDPSDTGILEREEWKKEFKEFKKKNSVNIMSLLIGNGVSDHWVSLFSDKIIHSDDFDSDHAHGIYADLNSKS